MDEKTFFNGVTKNETDIFQLILSILSRTDSHYCVIGGLAVNAYAEPVVSLDLDIVVLMQNMEEVCEQAIADGMTVQKFQHSVNLSSVSSDLRLQLQTDLRYQDFISRSSEKEILGYRMKVASIEDVLKGKIWAYSDDERRKSKRQKDLADIMRLVETQPGLVDLLPPDVRQEIED